MNRFKQIDILRAVAVLLVLGRHMSECPAELNGFLHRLTALWTRGGWIGVDLFFVLSGFLVSGLLFREYEKHHELHLGRFLIRRGFKIYPPFWLLSCATILMSLLWNRVFPAPLQIISELLFIQNYLPGLWGHTWSLAVEEHFYLLLGIALFFLVRSRKPQPFLLIPAVFMVVAVSCLALRIHMASHAAYTHRTHLWPTHLRLDALLFGVLLSYGYHQRPLVFLAIARRLKYAMAVCGILLLLPAFLYNIETTRWIIGYGLSMFYLGSGALLVASLGAAAPGTVFSKALATIGSHSYSIYLWHMPVAYWGTSLLRRLTRDQHNWYAYAAFYLLGSIALGIGMALLIESPVLRVRDRLFPSRGTPLTTRGTRP